MTDFFVDHPISTMFLVFLIITIPLFTVHINTGEKQYTGYIYSAEDVINRTRGQIRYSQNAGEDEQPAFCVRKEHGDTIKKYAGTDQKVKVTIPAGFAIDFPWSCPIEAKIEEI